MGFSVFIQSFAWHALLASGLTALACGVIAPFVISRRMSFAVHGTSELAFTGAAAGLLLADNPVLGAFGGAVVIAAVLGTLASKEHERDSSIGVVLAFGLGLGILLLSFYKGFATQATAILFGNILGVSNAQLVALLLVSLAALATMAIIFRPLFFASVDPAVAEARGINTKVLGVVFLFVLALTVTAAAQVVGTLLVLSLAITPAAAAMRFASRPLSVSLLSIGFALLAGVGGVLLSLASGTLKPSVCVSFLSFAIYLFARILGPLFRPSR